MGFAALSTLVVLRRHGLLARSALATARRSCDGLPWAGWALLAALAFLLMALGASAVRAATGGATGLRTGALMSFVSNTAPLSVLGAFLAIRPREARNAGLTARGTDALSGLAGLLLAFPIVWIAGYLAGQAALLHANLTGAAAPTSIAHETLRDLLTQPRTVWWWLTILAAGVAAPIGEEILFRGFIQSALVRAMGPSWAPVVLTSVLFTLIHFGAADPHALPALFMLSLAIGATFERTGRLGAPIVMHIGFNAINLAQALL